MSDCPREGCVVPYSHGHDERGFLVLPRFPAPNERTPEQHRIARSVMRASERAAEEFCEFLQAEVDRLGHDPDDLRAAVRAMGDFDTEDIWAEWVEDTD